MSTARNFSAYNYDDMMHQEIVTKALKFEKNNAAQRNKSNWANRILALLMIVIVFGSMAFLLIRYAEINEIKYNNFELKKDIEQLNIQVEEMKLQIDTAMSLENIENYAVEKLNMGHPKAEQMVYIQSATKYALNIENPTELVDNSTIVIDTEKSNDEGFFAMIIDTLIN